MWTPVWLGSFAVILFGPTGPLLARAPWAHRAPRAAVALWQAIGVAGALAAIGFGLSIAVAPLGFGMRTGLSDLAGQAIHGRPLQGLGMSGALGLTLAVDVYIVLLLGLAVTAMRTTRARTRHRRILDLVGRPAPDAAGVQILDDARAAAYCLPGVRPRIVVTSGARRLLDTGGLDAVVAHERGHARGHHGIVTLPFTSMDRLLYWLPYVRHARNEVATLLEMAADDFATKSNPPEILAAAIMTMAFHGATPNCTFGLGAHEVSARVNRLLGPDRASSLVAAATLITTAATLCLPFVALL